MRNYIQKTGLLLTVFMTVFSSLKLSAQTPTKCFEIESILVDACGPVEGENEMVRIKIGPSNINVSDLTVKWPNGAFKGFCQNAKTAGKIDSLNQTIKNCGWLIEPTGGVLPAGKRILIITSENFSTTLNSFDNLSDTLIVIFQCAGNTQGHFANFPTSGGTLTRTFGLKDTQNGCGDTVSYQRNELVNINQMPDTFAAQDGSTVGFLWDNSPYYYNNGCQAPIVVPVVDAGLDSAFCTKPLRIQLYGSTADVKTFHWSGGSGSFNPNDSTLNAIYSPSGSDTYPLSLYITGKFACGDSIRDTVVFILNPSTGSTQNVTKGCGQTFVFNGHTYSSTGIYYDTLKTAQGCDSIVTTNLLIGSPTIQNQNPTGCDKATYKGVDYFSSTNFQEVIKSVLGCDSVVVNVNITVNYSVKDTVQICILNGQQYFAGGQNQTASGYYIDNIPKAGGGCDTIRTTDLRVITPATNPQNIQDCKQVVYKGITYTSSATVSDTIKTSLGCDSLYNVTTITISGGAIIVTIPACINPGGSYFAAGQLRTTPGLYADTAQSVNSCDSITIVDLKLITPINTSLQLSDCKKVIYNGNTYTSSTVLNNTIKSSLNCDSVYETVTITITPTSIITNQTNCINDGQSFQVGNNTYTTTNIYHDTIPSINGCDSIINTDLRVVTPTVNYQQIDSCFSAWYNGKKYTKDTTITAKTLTSLGCDSIIDSLAIKIYKPTLKITSTETLPIFKGDSTQLILTPSGNYQNIIWSPTQNISNPTTANPFVKPITNTLYSINAEDAQGCKVSAQINISVKEPIPVIRYDIPTAFSPNGDGVNDFFRPILKGNADIISFRVYNRWGEKVYEQLGDGDGWDGTYQGVKQPISIFIYDLQVKDKNTNKTEHQSGNVTLVR